MVDQATLAQLNAVAGAWLAVLYRMGPHPVAKTQACEV